MTASSDERAGLLGVTNLLIYLLSTLPLTPPDSVQEMLMCCYEMPEGRPSCAQVPDADSCEDGVLHICSDTLTCNPDGSACWYECELAE